jgi:hypothetical protein
MYKLGTNCVMKFDGDEFLLCIPFDPDNTDAKEFAKWLAKGGIPEAAIEGETVSAEWIAETIAKLS